MLGECHLRPPSVELRILSHHKLSGLSAAGSGKQLTVQGPPRCLTFVLSHGENNSQHRRAVGELLAVWQCAGCVVLLSGRETREFAARACPKTTEYFVGVFLTGSAATAVAASWRVTRCGQRARERYARYHLLWRSQWRKRSPTHAESDFKKPAGEARRLQPWARRAISASRRAGTAPARVFHC